MDLSNLRDTAQSVRVHAWDRVFEPRDIDKVRAEIAGVAEKRGLHFAGTFSFRDAAGVS